MMILVTAAGVTDRQAARIVLPRLRKEFRKVTLIRADGGYCDRLATWAKEKLRLTVEIKRSDDVNRFVVLRRRWCVERTRLVVQARVDDLAADGMRERDVGAHVRPAWDG